MFYNYIQFMDCLFNKPKSYIKFGLYDLLNIKLKFNSGLLNGQSIPITRQCHLQS